MKHLKNDCDGMSPKASRQACKFPPLLPGPCQANTNSAPSGSVDRMLTQPPVVCHSNLGMGGQEAWTCWAQLSSQLVFREQTPGQGKAVPLLPPFPLTLSLSHASAGPPSPLPVSTPHRLSSLLSGRYSSSWTGLCPPKSVA